MRRIAAVAVAVLALGLVLGGAPPVAADHPECPAEATQCSFPTPQQCRAGDHNGVWDGGTDGRGAVCVAAGGAIVLYTGGNAPEACGVIIVGEQTVTGDPTVDPNGCP